MPVTAVQLSCIYTQFYNKVVVEPKNLSNYCSRKQSVQSDNKRSMIIKKSFGESENY